MASEFYGTKHYAATQDDNVSVSGLRGLQEEVFRQGLAGGYGQQIGSTGPVSVTPEQVVIYGIIRDDEFSTSADLHFNKTDASFIAPDGYPAYAFDEINPTCPWRGELLEGGVSTTMPGEPNSEGLVGGGNFAYSLNGESIQAGVKVKLRRAGEHWVIDVPPEAPSLSDDNRICIRCEPGGPLICFELGSDGHLHPIGGDGGTPPGTDPPPLTPQECYELCVANGGHPHECAVACGYDPPDPNPGPPIGQGSGGAGQGGFGP